MASKIQPHGPETQGNPNSECVHTWERCELADEIFGSSRPLFLCATSTECGAVGMKRSGAIVPLTCTKHVCGNRRCNKPAVGKYFDGPMGIDGNAFRRCWVHSPPAQIVVRNFMNRMHRRRRV